MIALVPEPRGLLEFSAPHVSIVFDDLVILSVRPKEVLRWVLAPNVILFDPWISSAMAMAMAMSIYRTLCVLVYSIVVITRLMLTRSCGGLKIKFQISN